MLHFWRACASATPSLRWGSNHAIYSILKTKTAWYLPSLAPCDVFCFKTSHFTYIKLDNFNINVKNIVQQQGTCKCLITEKVFTFFCIKLKNNSLNERAQSWQNFHGIYKFSLHAKLLLLLSKRYSKASEWSSICKRYNVRFLAKLGS